MRKRVLNVHEPQRDDINDLITRRALPGLHLNYLDPFLFLNHHGPQNYPPHNAGLPFGPHPHRGFETVTFIIEGSLAHFDNGGHASVIDAGGVQWMTAGRGIVHAEVSPDEFKRTGGPLEILQLWINLPGRLKMCAPRYLGLQAKDIPSIQDAGATLRLIAGEWQGLRGPVDTHTGVFMSIVNLEEGGRLFAGGLQDRNVFIYVVSGAVMVEGGGIPEHHVPEFDLDGDELEVVANSETILLFGHAAPLREPVAAHGPFVMNTAEEIAQAIADYRAGRFGGL